MRKRGTKRAKKSRRSTPEGLVLRSILDYLAAKRILCFRMNTGFLQSKGGSWVRFGTVGMADILAFPAVSYIPTLKGALKVEGGEWVKYIQPLWIEAKAEKRRQTPDQAGFQKIVQDNGHAYIVARSIDDVESWLKEHGA